MPGRELGVLIHFGNVAAHSPPGVGGVHVEAGPANLAGGIVRFREGLRRIRPMASTRSRSPVNVPLFLLGGTLAARVGLDRRGWRRLERDARARLDQAGRPVETGRSENACKQWPTHCQRYCEQGERECDDAGQNGEDAATGHDRAEITVGTPHQWHSHEDGDSGEQDYDDEGDQEHALHVEAQCTFRSSAGL